MGKGSIPCYNILHISASKFEMPRMQNQTGSKEKDEDLSRRWVRVQYPVTTIFSFARAKDFYESSK